MESKEERELKQQKKDLAEKRRILLEQARSISREIQKIEGKRTAIMLEKIKDTRFIK